MKLGHSIRKLRVNKVKQSQGEFALNIGINQSYLSQIENDQKEPSTDLLQRIADYIGVPLPILFWFAIEETDVVELKRGYFHFLKPTIDEMLKKLF